MHFISLEWHCFSLEKTSVPFSTNSGQVLYFKDKQQSVFLRSTVFHGEQTTAFLFSIHIRRKLCLENKQ